MAWILCFGVCLWVCFGGCYRSTFNQFRVVLHSSHQWQWSHLEMRAWCDTPYILSATCTNCGWKVVKMNCAGLRESSACVQ